ncbi:MAG: hypothetical protein LBG44_05345, partial [Gemmatimonadota bacterium]|nr:hypothetical protein [Gemmatimonadota bacterium]
TTTDPRVGLVLFAVLVGFVYYPTMLSEEEYLIAKFPAVAAGRAFPWRLIPDPRRLPEAISTDCFTVQTAWNNLGFRSAWFILGLPLFLRVLQWVQGMFW